jgi:hypothetical protein
LISLIVSGALKRPQDLMTPTVLGAILSACGIKGWHSYATAQSVAVASSRE